LLQGLLAVVFGKAVLAFRLAAVPIPLGAAVESPL
jgi:hypothetical protein